VCHRLSSLLWAWFVLIFLRKISFRENYKRDFLNMDCYKSIIFDSKLSYYFAYIVTEPNMFWLVKGMFNDSNDMAFILWMICISLIKCSYLTSICTMYFIQFTYTHTQNVCMIFLWESNLLNYCTCVTSFTTLNIRLLKYSWKKCKRIIDMLWLEVKEIYLS
jgi:hypothetical protein